MQTETSSPVEIRETALISHNHNPVLERTSVEDEVEFQFSSNKETEPQPSIVCTQYITRFGDGRQFTIFSGVTVRRMNEENSY